MGTRMAKTIKIIRLGHGIGQPIMVIDGEEFPFYTVDGYHVDVTRAETPCVTVSIAAERVEIVDDATGKKPYHPDDDFENVHDAVLAVALGNEPVGA